jgi:hypothetical protein
MEASAWVGRRYWAKKIPSMVLATFVFPCVKVYLMSVYMATRRAFVLFSPLLSGDYAL